MLKVLVIEDEPAVRLVIEKVLRREGFVVVTAETGDEACRSAEDCGDFDIAIVDCVLPGALHGADLVDCLRRTCEGIGIIQMSGYPDQVNDHRPETSYDMMLSKPVLRADLLEAVNFVCQARAIERQDVS